MKLRIRTLAAAGLAVTTLLLGEGVPFADVAPTEYQVKAAFLYNFAKFVEWPATAFAASGGAMVLGVFGNDPFGTTLDRIARDQTVQGRRIIVRRANKLGDIGTCHILFVRPPDDVNLASFIRGASATGRLLVGEAEGFAQRGGVIGFFVEQRRVRFMINVSAAERAGLRVSSKLLSVARVIHEP